MRRHALLSGRCTISIPWVEATQFRIAFLLLRTWSLKALIVTLITVRSLRPRSITRSKEAQKHFRKWYSLRFIRVVCGKALYESGGRVPQIMRNLTLHVMYILKCTPQHSAQAIQKLDLTCFCCRSCSYKAYTTTTLLTA